MSIDIAELRSSARSFRLFKCRRRILAAGKIFRVGRSGHVLPTSKISGKLTGTNFLFPGKCLFSFYESEQRLPGDKMHAPSGAFSPFVPEIFANIVGIRSRRRCGERGRAHQM